MTDRVVEQLVNLGFTSLHTLSIGGKGITDRFAIIPMPSCHAQRVSRLWLLPFCWIIVQCRMSAKKCCCLSQVICQLYILQPRLHPNLLGATGTRLCIYIVSVLDSSHSYFYASSVCKQLR